MVLCAWGGVVGQLRGVAAAQPHASDRQARATKDHSSDVRGNSPVMYELSGFSVVSLSL